MAEVGIWEPPVPDAPPTPRTPSLVESIGRNVLVGLAIFLPLPVKRPFAGDPRAILVALFVLFVLAFVADYVDAGRGAVFQRWCLYALCAILVAKVRWLL
ncbi:MAG: hypothetical protein OXH09_08920, partial [Gammaproteobacteria bacterium]|nr:hypothetical protein [Gammaproteobacteria bacterium]